MKRLHSVEINLNSRKVANDVLLNITLLCAMSCSRVTDFLQMNCIYLLSFMESISLVEIILALLFGWE